MSQKDEILEDLKRGSRLTRLTCLERHGSMNLPARVCEYRAAGVNVDDVWIETYSGKRVKEYFIPRQSS